MKALLSFLETRFHHLFPFKEQSCFQKLCQKGIDTAVVSFQFNLRQVSFAGRSEFLFHVFTHCRQNRVSITKRLNMDTTIWLVSLLLLDRNLMMTSELLQTMFQLYDNPTGTLPIQFLQKGIGWTELDNREGNIGDTRISGTLGSKIKVKSRN